MTAEDDRSRLDGLRAWLLGTAATRHAEDVRWAVQELERLRPDLCIGAAA